MPTTITLKSGSTVAATGGSDVVHSVFNNSNPNVAAFENLAQAYGSRQMLKAKVSRPKADASTPGGYTQARTDLVLSVPKVLANGKTTFNSVKIQIAYDVETTDAEKAELEAMGAQLFIDSELQSARRNQTLA